MYKAILTGLLSILLCTSFACADNFAFPFIGKWNPSDAPITIEEYGYQDIQNLRPDGKRLKGVGGHTTINSTPITNSHVAGMFHYRKSTPFPESHLLLSVDDSDASDGSKYSWWDNTTAIPSAGEFATEAITSHTVVTPDTEAKAYFAVVPQDTLFFSDGQKVQTWGGTEANPLAVYIMDDTIVGGAATEFYDYTEALTTSSTDDGLTALWGEEGTDPNIVLLWHCEGAGGSTTITDDGATDHTASTTAYGDAQIDTGQYRFGKSALDMDGDGDYVSVADHADFYLDGDFTIHFWFHLNTPSYQGGVFQQRVDDNNVVYAELYDSGTFRFRVVVGGSTLVELVNDEQLTTPDGLYPGVFAWGHVALTRSGDQWKFYYNGVERDTVNAAVSYPDLAAPFEVGRHTVGGADYSILVLDEFTIIKDTVLWNDDFEPPVRSQDSYSGEYLLVGSPYKLYGVQFYINRPNPHAATVTPRAYMEGGWRNLASYTVNTTQAPGVGGRSMYTDGSLEWGKLNVLAFQGESKLSLVQSRDLYWYEFEFLGGNVELSRITVLQDPQAINNISDGDEVPLASFFHYDLSGTDYIDENYTTYLQSNTVDTYVEWGALPNTDHLLVGFAEPVKGINIRIREGAENSSAAIGSISYRGHNGWVDVANGEGIVFDATPLSHTGVSHWDGPDSWLETKYVINDGVAANEPLYYYRIKFSSALSATVNVYHITGLRNTAPLPDYVLPAQFAERAWLFNETHGEHNKAVYSAFNAPYVWNGPDSGELHFGSGGEITAAATLFNVFNTTGYEQLVVTKANETYRVLGDSPETWDIKQVDGVIGCVAPRSMAVCGVQRSSETAPRQVAIWQSASGIVKFDGAKIEYISDEIKAYWDANSDLFVAKADQPDSVGWYDPDLRAYKLILGGTELEYSLEHESWTKLYREDGSGANPLVAGCRVADLNGLGYTYGVNAAGDVYRLENGNDWDSVADIDQYVWTKDMMLNDQAPFFKDTAIEWLRLMYDDKTATDDITFNHYCNGVLTVDGTDDQALPDAVGLDDGPIYTTDVTLGPCHYHSLKISTDTDAVDGLELNGLGVVFKSYDAISQ